MTRTILFIGLTALTLAAGCDTSERQKLNAQQAVAEYDLRDRCSRDAKTWFNENWSSDKNIVIPDYTNHYDKAMNKCFILLEHHVPLEGKSWTNYMQLWDVQENTKYGSFSQVLPDHPPVTCEVLKKKCKTLEEFNGLAAPYMNN